MISVLIANYNNGRYIEDAVNSVIDQTFKDWEVVIVDDGSTDNSLETLERLYSNNPKIKVISRSGNLGCGHTKHECVQNASGEWCVFLDPDDALVLNAMEKVWASSQYGNEYAMVYSTFWYCDHNLSPQKTATWVGEILGASSNVVEDKISHLCFFNREKYLQTDGIDQRLKSAVDKDLYYKMEETGLVSFVPEPLYLYRQNNAGISQAENLLKAAENHWSVILSAYKRRKEKNHQLRISYLELRRLRSKIFMRIAHQLYGVEKSIFHSLKYVFLSYTQWPFNQNKNRVRFILKMLTKKK